jgi:hypothetical protein
MKILGIDPGKDGFLCLLSNGDAPQFWPTPTVRIGKGASQKRDYNVAAMRRIIINCSPDCVVLEKQQAMQGPHGRKQGVATTGQIMYGYGLWLGLVAGIGLPLQTCHPRTWQALILKDVQGVDTKARSIIAAGRLFPTVDLRATDRCRTPHNGKADALLLAYWGKIAGMFCEAR